MDGFNELSCIGIIGDGCGGGRVFSVEDNTLKAFDPQSKENIILLEGLKDVTAIRKKGCFIYLTCKDKVIEFDLSTFKN